jgi:hypothetical protein
MKEERGGEAMTERKILGYQAEIENEWLPLSDQHATYLKRIDEYVSELSKGNKNVPRIAIVGPYGQGKTQLLFHIMKLTLKNGGIAIYTHADRIVSLIESKAGQDRAILPSELPPLLKDAIMSDLKNLSKSDNLLLITDPEVLTYLRNHTTGDTAKTCQVLLVDEVEQAYELLQQKIKTSDRNPIRSLLDSKEIYTVLAFAPRSMYEYKLGATLSEGEAERSRFETIYLPPVTAQQIKKFLNIPEKGFANFIWWMSRGRARFLIKAFQQSQNYSLNEQRGFKSFVEAMGKISGVPCFDLDALVDKGGKFIGNWKEVFKLIPAKTGEDKERALLFKIDGDFDKKATEFFGKLGFSGSHSMTLSDYLNFLLDGVSGDDGEAVVKKKDSLALVRATYELALEHTHDEKLIAELQRRLDDLQAQPDLRYSLPDMMEEVGIGESVKPDKLLPFDFDKLLEFFPFPLSSPQMPEASKEDVSKWLNELPDLPLAEDEESSVVVSFFKDFDHFKRYCENEKHTFVEKVLPERKKTVILLLEGEISPKDLPALARWLRNQGRLQIEKLRPSLLSDFLANALYLIKPNFKQPRPYLRKELETLGEKFEEKNDRATVGKILRYSSALNELVSSLPAEFAALFGSFAYERRGVAFEGEFLRQRGTEAFYYPLTLAFFDEDTEGLRALAQIRSLAERTGRSLFEFLPEKGGYRTAISFLPATDRKGVPRHSESIETIRSQYKDKMDALEELVKLLSKEEILNLVEDELTRYLLQTYHDAQKFSPLAQGEKETIADYLRNSLEKQRKILEQEQSLKAGIGIGFEASLKFSPEQEQAIRELLAIIEKADAWRSVIYQRVFLIFVEQLAIGIKENADRCWKSLNELPPEKFQDLSRLGDLLTLPDQMPEEIFKYLNISRDKLASELKKKRAEIEKEIQSKSIGGLGPLTIDALHEYFGELIALRENAEELRKSIVPIREELLSRYRELGKA